MAPSDRGLRQSPAKFRSITGRRYGQWQQQSRLKAPAESARKRGLDPMTNAGPTNSICVSGGPKVNVKLGATVGQEGPMGGGGLVTGGGRIRAGMVNMVNGFK